MTDEDQKNLDAIVDTVSAAITAGAPVAGPYAPIVVLIVQAVRGLIGLAEQLGHGDAVKAALDAELAAGRQLTDAALAPDAPKYAGKP